MNNRVISLAHGSGGRLTQELIEEIIYPAFGNNGGNPLLDSALLTIDYKKIAFTTDSFVVSPLFFEGGDIGKLAACGTINDLAVCGATPLYISVGLIIEEGFSVELLKKILRSLASAAGDAGVLVVTGDTKVVERGNADGIYINTAGIGVLPQDVRVGPEMIEPGDLIFISGAVGDHGMSVLTKREGLSYQIPVASDCAPLNSLIKSLLETSGIKCMKDPTRGGLATALVELAEQSKTLMEISEERIPIRQTVSLGCDLLGLDPLYLANEGNLLIIAKADKESEIAAVLDNHPLGKEAKLIGRVVSYRDKGMVLLETPLGVKRILTMLEGEQLPRIC
ncbi:MAG: hydrogenase expression/formation protein HypE [Peptococcaceae bacterium]|nr:hydrogenase expression/formation protein HypE [Peptococcaceae bacterium]